MGTELILLFATNILPFIMKTAIAIFCLFLAVANAVPQRYYYGRSNRSYYSRPKPATYGIQPDSCFEGRKKACAAQFGGPAKIASYNCKGWCGLCDLCGTPQAANVPECGTFCAPGVEKCTEVCENGKQACLACGFF